ncbi:POTRA domain-containing protein [Pseudomonas sp. NW5]|uniref:ShlB/FhaC/HecB family hemolysin secretion/activation protein n=1 Tax=Pseudomonas sp. NW5 TaxID=2934934 RepID=UPI002020EC2A|nr:POTRA domain-containing protein [Pseudomonas sp. NW5]MCL7462311.1 ShlB/FhaC/HecB family hemolysin secretion/activation protein [Pseudomonas sp. NW5]
MRARSIRLIPSLALLAAVPVWAQTPAFTNSNDVDSVLPRANLPVEELRPREAEVRLPTTQPQPRQAMAAVRLQGVLIEGGTVYPFEEIAALYQPLIGRTVALSDVLAVTQKITQRYQADGYALSYAFVPAQDLRSGQVRVVLVEGYISVHEARGDIGRAQGYIDQLAAKLVGERPLRRESFQRYTTLMAQMPGVKVRASVAPPSTTDGAVTLVTEATRQPFATNASINDGSQDSFQAVLGVSSNSQTALGEQVSVSTLAPEGEDRERYARIDYSQFINAEGTRLQAFASTYRSEPEDRVAIGAAQTELARRNDRVSVGVKHPIRLAGGEILSATARLYGVDDERKFTRVEPQPVIKDALELESKVRVLALEGEQRTAKQGQLRVLGAGVYQGLNTLGADYRLTVLGNQVEPGSKPDLDFLRLRLNALESNQFGGAWQGVASGVLYWSEDTLPESEQVLFGDRNFGRGYSEDQARGDKGWGLSYELNRTFNREGTWVRMLQPYAVLDKSRTWYNESGNAANLSSLALGMRFGDRKYYNLAVEAAKPLGDKAIDTNNREPRVGFTLNYDLR